MMMMSLGQIRESSMRFRIALVLVVLLLVLVLAGGASAQSSVPENGAFIGGRTGWALTSSYSYDCSYDAADGYGANGKLIFYYACWVYSLPFRVSSSSTLSFAAKSDIVGVLLDVDVVCANPSSVLFADALLGTSWAVYSVNLSGLALQDCRLRFRAHGGGYAVSLDDVSVLSASNWIIGDGGGINGNFLGNSWGWYDGTNNCSLWEPDNGYLGLGDIKFADTWCKLESMPFTSSAAWTVGYKKSASGSGNAAFRALDFDGTQGEQTILTIDPVGNLSWAVGNLDLSSFGNHRLMWRVQAGFTHIDDICPAGGCALGTPTPQPTSTWTSAPTSTPIPLPTGGGGSGANATPIYGLNTPQPVRGGGSTGLCPSTDPCYFLNPLGTPVQVDLLGVGGTPISGGGGIPIQGGNTTPVYVATPTIATITPMAGGGASSALVASVSYKPSGINGVMPIGVSGTGSIDDVAQADISKYNLNVCLPSDISKVFTVGAVCAMMPVWQVVNLKIFGYDVVNAMSGVLLVLFTTFVVVRVRSK